MKIKKKENTVYVVLGGWQWSKDIRSNVLPGILAWHRPIFDEVAEFSVLSPHFPSALATISVYSSLQGRASQRFFPGYFQSSFGCRPTPPPGPPKLHPRPRPPQVASTRAPFPARPTWLSPAVVALACPLHCAWFSHQWLDNVIPYFWAAQVCVPGGGVDSVWASLTDVKTVENRRWKNWAVLYNFVSRFFNMFVSFFFGQACRPPKRSVGAQACFVCPKSSKITQYTFHQDGLRRD